jgi:ferric-dicitrate binding protein FerR (iron transport regulator)
MTDARPDPTPDPTLESKKARLIAYLDGECSPEEAREVAQWLASHPEARLEADEHRAVWRLLGAYGDEPVPAGFSTQVMDAVRDDIRDDVATPTPGRASFALLRGGGVRRVAVAASILVAAGLGVLFGRKTAPGGDGLGASTAIEAMPAEVLSGADIDTLADLSDEDFEVLLSGDPDDLADVTRGG